MICQMPVKKPKRKERNKERKTGLRIVKEKTEKRFCQLEYREQNGDTKYGFKAVPDR